MLQVASEGSGETAEASSMQQDMRERMDTRKSSSSRKMKEVETQKGVFISKRMLRHCRPAVVEALPAQLAWEDY
eukprot:1580437-Rhodomonas_salina.1